MVNTNVPGSVSQTLLPQGLTWKLRLEESGNTQDLLMKGVVGEPPHLVSKGSIQSSASMILATTSVEAARLGRHHRTSSSVLFRGLLLIHSFQVDFCVSQRFCKPTGVTQSAFCLDEPGLVYLLTNETLTETDGLGFPAGAIPIPLSPEGFAHGMSSTWSRHPHPWPSG